MPGPERPDADPAAGADPRPHITLAQFLKLQRLAESGGQAKARVRAGGILVDGTEELRPGRKLFGGETVTVDGEEYDIELAPPDSDREN